MKRFFGSVVAAGLACLLALALIGLSFGDEGGGDTSLGDDSETGFSYVGAEPTPAPAPGDRALGTPLDMGNQTGRYAFMFTKAGSQDPITYDPCRPIKVVVNTRTQPREGMALINQSLAEISRATGLQFQVEGPTDEATTPDRAPFQPDRYGDRWAPVLIGWSDPSEYHELKKDTAGEAGSVWIGAEDGSRPQTYVTGRVALDGPQFEEILNEPDGYRTAKSILQHELAHLVGLDHVDDSTQLMYPESLDVLDFQAGDLVGLSQLGKGECVAAL